MLPQSGKRRLQPCCSHTAEFAPSKAYTHPSRMLRQVPSNKNKSTVRIHSAETLAEVLGGRFPAFEMLPAALLGAVQRFSLARDCDPIVPLATIVAAVATTMGPYTSTVAGRFEVTG